MNEKQLRTFVSAAESKSFSKSADVFGISTTALINQINLLEKKTGLVLFKRNTHGIELTENGRNFYKAAVKILQIYDDTITECKRDEGKFIINICDYLGTYDNSSFTYSVDYMLEHPDIVIRITERRNPDELVNLVRADEIQAFTTVELEDHMMQGLRFIPIMEDRYNVVVSKRLYDEAGRNLHNLLKGRTAVLRALDYRKDKSDLSMYGKEAEGEIRVIPPSMGTNEYLMDVIDDNISIVPANYCHIHSNLIEVIPTGVSAGRYGVILSKDADVRTLEFVSQLRAYIHKFLEDRERMEASRNKWS